jgi:probable F420-dependent oxidoreductase
MRFGLALPHYGFSLPDAQPISFEAMSGVALRAEALGFDSLWVSDHLFYSFSRYGSEPSPIASLEAMTALSGLAAVTERARLGSLVLSAPFRHPALLAKMAATIDRISGGRFDLGIGTGWFEEEFTAFGFPFGSVGERFALLEDSLKVLTGLPGPGPVTLDAGPFHLRDAVLLPPPIQEPRPPVWLGAKGGDRALDLAARYADGWNTVWRWTPEAYGDRVAAARRACEAVGRDPATLRLSVGLYGLIGADEEQARAVFERGRVTMPGGAMDDEDYDDWRADTLSGTPQQVRERVGAFEALGVEELVLSPWVLPFALHEPEQLELFAQELIASGDVHG